jgi:hypothetical protein
MELVPVTPSTVPFQSKKFGNDNETWCKCFLPFPQRDCDMFCRNGRAPRIIWKGIGFANALVRQATTGCVHGKNCGAKCHLNYPPVDALDSCCYDHDYDIEYYDDPIGERACNRGVTKGFPTYCSFDRALISCIDKKVLPTIKACAWWEKLWCTRDALRGKAAAVSYSMTLKLRCSKC